MASQVVGFFVVCERYGAIFALWCVSAIGTFDARGISSFVMEQNCSLFVIDVLFDEFYELIGETVIGLVFFSQFGH